MVSLLMHSVGLLAYIGVAVILGYWIWSYRDNL